MDNSTVMLAIGFLMGVLSLALWMMVMEALATKKLRG